MGGTTYSTSNRSYRSTTMGYDKATTDNMGAIFTQKKLQRAHEQMLPSNIKRILEARDSEVHPRTIAVQLYLDVTGSMLGIPVYLIKEGLPHIMERLEAAGVKHVALLFGAIGDHESDIYPLQLGQFESGDEELDMWLTRTYPEGGGGNNGGESYGLAWYNAAHHVDTDQYVKRKEKGFVFTIGDEPILKAYPGTAIKEIYGKNAPEVKPSYTAQELYDLCSKKYHTFHIHVAHTSSSRTDIQHILGQNCMTVNAANQIADLIVNTIVSTLKMYPQSTDNVEPIIINDDVNGYTEDLKQTPATAEHDVKITL